MSKNLKDSVLALSKKKLSPKEISSELNIPLAAVYSKRTELIKSGKIPPTKHSKAVQKMWDSRKTTGTPKPVRNSTPVKKAVHQKDLTIKYHGVTVNIQKESLNRVFIGPDHIEIFHN